MYQTGCKIVNKSQWPNPATYVRVTPDMAARIVKEHIKGGQPVVEYTIGAVEK